MKVEWSAEALEDLNRFAEFLNDHYPSLAPIVAEEIVNKSTILADEPGSADLFQDAKNTGKLSCVSSMRLTCFNIATTESD